MQRRGGRWTYRPAEEAAVAAAATVIVVVGEWGGEGAAHARRGRVARREMVAS